MVNLLCLASMASKGELTNPRDWPIYETKMLKPNELYKIQQAYDAWNKTHRKTQTAAARDDSAPASSERVGVHAQ
jgi:hypothetical protein